MLSFPSLISQMQERLKKEYKSANKVRESYIDESEEEDEDDSKLTGAGKNLQKTLKKLEKGGGYEEDSDDDKNPYASSVRACLFGARSCVNARHRRKRRRKRNRHKHRPGQRFSLLNPNPAPALLRLKRHRLARQRQNLQ